MSNKLKLIRNIKDGSFRFEMVEDEEDELQ